jgi:signal transduction histidine kinase
MVSGLKELDKLKIDRDDLEGIVKKRTAEIEEAMAVMENGTRKLNKSQTAMLYMVEDLNRQSNDLRNAQDTIVRSEKLAAIGQLASSVAHELRNPLGVMKNVVYYFNMLGLGKEDADIQENLDILDKEIKTSDKIISDILDFTRIKKPTLRLENINMVLEDTLKRLDVGPEIKVVKELEEPLPNIEVDAMQLQQVFTNIVQNAMQSMDNSGRLKIRTSCNDDFIETDFTDTGIGISEKELGKIFDPLFSNKVNGTGLGLSVCASLVEGHGGKIDVSSETGNGTTFTVKLPIKHS